MNAPAKSFSVEFHGDAALGAVLEALAPHADKTLVIDYGGQTIQPGYHVTEVKAGSFQTLDCGGNPDSWRETILQVEDLPRDREQSFMRVGKLIAILSQVQKKVALDPEARLTFEVGPPGVPMQVFDVDTLQFGTEQIVLRLAARSAICKPRHRAAKETASRSCCGPASQNNSACCGV